MARWIACASVVVAMHAARAQVAPHWVGTWTASPASGADLGVAVENRTIRQFVHTSIGGPRLRVRLANTFGAEALRIDAVTVALAVAGVATSTARTVAFGGMPSVTIAAGDQVVSDPVRLHVPADAEVMVSIYIPAPSGPLTWHRFASATTYVSVPGDHAGAESMDAFWYPKTSFFVLDGLEVAAPRSVRAVVAFGDSITDGVGSSVDANRRYPNFLARRLRAAGRRMAVLDAGIGGNRILTDTGAAGPSARSRFARDVLGQAGVSTVVWLEGINDIGFSEVSLDVCPICVDVSPDEMAVGYEQVIAEAHRHGLRIVGGTLLPFAGAFDYADRTEAKRQAVNEWIRHRSSFDGIVDFDAVMGDPADPLRLRAAYDSGDHLHPSDAGYEAMAAAIDLRCLRRARRLAARTDCTLRP